jgi:hypothetical protein
MRSVLHPAARAQDQGPVRIVECSGGRHAVCRRISSNGHARLIVHRRRGLLDLTLDLVGSSVRLTDDALERAADHFRACAIAGWLGDGALGTLRPDRVEFTKIVSRHIKVACDDFIALYVPGLREPAQ